MEYQTIYARLQQNLDLLRQREAKYGGNAPVDLINQITDHQQAVALTRRRLVGGLSEAAWQAEMKPLLVDIEKRQSEAAQVQIGTILGNLSGNVAGGDITIHYHTDPALQDKVAQLEAAIATQRQNLAGLLDAEQIEATIAPLKAQLDSLQAQLSRQAAEPDYTTPDRATLEGRYLRRLWKEVSHLSLLHIDPGAAEQRMELVKVYTALLTTGSEERQPEALARTGEKPKPVSALAHLNRHDRLVLLGDPGGGKSTFVNFVALCMAGALLVGDGTYLNLLRTPLPPDDEEERSLRREEKEPQPQPWDHGPLLPVKIVLRKFAGEGLPPPGQEATAKHVWAYLATQFEATDLSDYLPMLKHCFEHEGGLLCFDGLDELPDPEQRGPQIKQVVEDMAAGYPRCRILVTSRPYAYQNPAWQLQGFAQTSLAPFSKGQIERFIEQWYAYLGTLNQWTEDSRQRRVAQLTGAIFGHESRLRELAERPLLLTLMANLHASRGTLPEKRADLYEETVVLLLDRWERGRFATDRTVLSPTLSDWLEVEQRKIRALLEDLAYEAHANQPDKAEGTANLDGERLLGGLLALTRRAIHPADLLDYLDQRAGILEARGDNIYSFPHRTFQEYLAACHLTGRDDFAGDTARLVREDTTRWREVALLAGARAASGMTAAIWLLVDELCPRPVGRAYVTVTEMMAALIGGQAIVETANLEQPSEAHRYKIERVRGWLKHSLATNGLPALERATAGRVLAVLGDDREGVGVENGLPAPVWCEVAAGSFIMGSDEGRDNEKPAHEVTLPAYQISRYPMTNAQFEPFIADGGYTEKWRRCWTEAGWQQKERDDWQEPRYWNHNRYNQANQPVVGVSWYEAVAFCRWLTERLRAAGAVGEAEVIRLPTEAEWEKAARGPHPPLIPPNGGEIKGGRIYPWGDEADPDKANYSDTGLGEPSAVGCFVKGQSPCGGQDMAGNVWEWCATQWPDWDEPKPYPYDVTENEWDEEYQNRTSVRVLRGGAFDFLVNDVRAPVRVRNDPGSRNGSRGFRLVRAPIGSES